ncbi:hypothetical protein GUJ93_ZPchr0004g38797 [Zizania palustris]|uniref:Uncharacterized protein n=1 Tax=Zizania palustris TaxID=103762 RepID=A0A8J5V8Y8_ZIZPA|nr:hypothetical protein GUJ93_ZPchr0004g38797 [Zizania palustris]
MAAKIDTSASEVSRDRDMVGGMATGEVSFIPPTDVVVELVDEETLADPQAIPTLGESGGEPQLTLGRAQRGMLMRATVS